MAKAVLGTRGIESAVRSMTPEQSVIVLARSYDKLVRDLEYALCHISQENLQPELQRLLKERER